MKEIRWIDNNICQYVFIENKDKPYIDVNITVLLNRENAMIIDTAYTSQAAIVKNDLASKGITVDEIVLSHYHPDHAAGATEFPNTALSCSVHYKENYNNCNDIWHKEHNYRKPQKLIQDNTTKKYGKFSLDFFEAPGHSKCSIVTLIDRRIAHVGDLMMFDVNHKPTLPNVCGDGSFEDHIKSLEKIKELSVEVLIFSHGKHIVGKASIDNEIDMRIHYLKSVLESNGEADLEDFLIGGLGKWGFTEWHKINLKNL